MDSPRLPTLLCRNKGASSKEPTARLSGAKIGRFGRFQCEHHDIHPPFSGVIYDLELSWSIFQHWRHPKKWDSHSKWPTMTFIHPIMGILKWESYIRILLILNDGTHGTPEFQPLGIGSPTLRVAMAGSTAVPAVPVTGVALELGLSQETNQQWNTSGTRWYK